MGSKLTLPVTDEANCSVRGAILLMLLSVILFAGNALMIRALGDIGKIDSWIVATFRFVVGFAVLFGFFYSRGGFQPRNMLTNPLLILRGVLGGVGIWIFYLTIIELGAGRATFIANTYVVFGAVVAGLFLRERLSVRLIASLVVAMVGLALLTSANELRIPGRYELLGILGAVIAGVIVVCIRKLHERENSSTIFGAQCLYGLIISAAPTAIHATPLPALAVFLLVGSGLLAAFGQLSMTRAFKDLPVGQGSMMQLLLPPVIAAGGVIFFDETYSTIELVGIGLILTACLATVQARPRLAVGLLSPETKPGRTTPPDRTVG